MRKGTWKDSLWERFDIGDRKRKYDLVFEGAEFKGALSIVNELAYKRFNCDDKISVFISANENALVVDGLLVAYVGPNPKGKRRGVIGMVRKVKGE